MHSWQETFGKFRLWPLETIPSITARPDGEGSKAEPPATALSLLAALSHAANGLLVTGLLIGVPFFAFSLT